MATLRTIIVGYDGFDRDEPVPRIAVRLAADHGARLRVVNVLPLLPDDPWKSRTVSAVELQQSLIDHRQERLDALLEPARAEGVSGDAAIRIGSSAVELIRDAVEHEADLLIVVDEPSAGGTPAFGATTMKLLRDCPCPVLAKRAADRTSYSRIMAAVDLGPEGAAENAPNPAIMDMATTLARVGHAELLVMHAWSLWGEHTLRWRAHVSDDEMDEIRREAEAAQRGYLDAFVGASKVDDVVHRQVLTKGEPDVAIPAAVEAHGVDLLVMGTVSRTGIPGFVIGNTAERILNRVGCSVLTVKPDAFVSPLA